MRLVLQLNMTLVDMHTRLSMFGKSVVHTWRYCRGLNKEILCCFSEGQTPFGMPRGAEISFDPQ